MKTLYLIRHAKSSWKEHDLSDFDRPLNGRGKKAAPFMGQRLKQQGILPDLILSSSANRAFTTAKIIADEIGYPKTAIVTTEDLYLASVQAMLHIINSIENIHNTVFIFAHNPGTTALSYYLTDHYIDNVPTTGICKIEFKTDNWQEISGGTGTLKYFDYPKRHAADL